MHVVTMGYMELLPVNKDYDTISDNVREFSAKRLYELIEGMRPFVAEALSDPGGLFDTEPGRIQAHAALIKLQVGMIKELGALYRVTYRPEPAEVEPMIPASKVEALMQEAAVRMEEAVAAAALEAELRAREDERRREQLSLEAAKQRVTTALAGLKRE